MSYTTTVGRVLLKHNSPASTHSFLDSKELDKKNIGAFFADLADNHSDQYKKVVSDLTRIGFESATRLGSTVRLGDLLPPAFKAAKFKKLDEDINEIHSKKLTKTKERDAIVDLLNKFQDEVNKELVETGIKENKTLAKIVKAGARGSPAQYRQTVFSPVAVNDNKGGILTDFIIDRSFAEGLTLPQYLAHTFGSRQASAATKLCCFEDTSVLMADFSVKLIKDIKPGEWVMGANKQGQSFPVKVLNSFNNGVKDCYNYIFRPGCNKNELVNLIATEDHNILATITDTSMLRPIVVPQLLPLSRARRYFHAEPVNALIEDNGVYDHKALFLGLMLGDGYTGDVEGGMQYSCADDSLIEDIQHYMSTLNYRLNKTGPGYSYCLKQIETAKKKVVNGKVYSGCPIRTWLKDLNLLGKLTHDKFLPSEVFGWNSEAISMLLCGLFSTDGSIRFDKRRKTTNISFQVTSRRLVEDIKLLLQYKFGIYTSPIYTVKKETKPFATHDQYGIRITNPVMVQKFYTLIPLVGIKKTTISNYIKASKPITTRYVFNFVKKEYYGKVNTFDLEVDHPEHLFCLPSGLIISNSVADGGYLGKQLSRSNMTMTVDAHDCGTNNGIAIKVDDKDYIGSYLAKPVDKYHHNNEVTSSMLATLKNKGIHDIIVRNPITCQASHDNHPNAVCQLCVGRREKGLPTMGSFIGIVAGSTLAEPVSQGALNSKHSGGSARSSTSFGGIKYINQLFNIPETFVHEAPLADKDGVVSDVRVASQGGHYIDIKHDDGTTAEHYVHPDLNTLVHKGHVVEPGDVLSEGIPNPAKIVQHKGIGAGRVYFSNQIKNTFETSQLGGINKRNFDTISKNLITHVKITNPKGLGNFLPDSIVNYHTLEKDYQPRLDSRKVRIDAAKGLYLEKPELHYTIGTRLTNGMIANLKHHGVESVLVHDEGPGFEPEMQRLLEGPANEHDWMHALYSTNLERRLIKAVNTGASSNIAGPSPVPGLAYAVGFGKKSEEEEEEELLSFE